MKTKKTNTAKSTPDLKVLSARMDTISLVDNIYKRYDTETSSFVDDEDFKDLQLIEARKWAVALLLKNISK